MSRAWAAVSFGLLLGCWCCVLGLALARDWSLIVLLACSVVVTLAIKLAVAMGARDDQV